MKTLDIVIPSKNSGEELVSTIKLWLTQKIPNDWQIKIYLIDDGSTDDSVARLKSLVTDERLTIIRNPSSLGRSKAINQGADKGTGEYIAFFDADCIPVNNEALYFIIQSILKESPAIIFGKLIASGNNFWNQYFNEVSRKRELAFSKGNPFALTTAHLTICRSLFESINGFDERYVYYGFEDRDLLIRAYKKECHFIFQPHSIVNHNDKLTLRAICKKMKIAGQTTSKLFKESHPKEYREMLFSKVDYQELVPFLRTLLLLIAQITIFMTSFFDKVLDLKAPFIIKSLIVKYYTACAFLLGSSNKKISDDY